LVPIRCRRIFVLHGRARWWILLGIRATTSRLPRRLQEIRQQANRQNDPGRFVAYVGWEWSGNTPVGGDHNVYYPGEDGPLHRSSHVLINDKSDAATDCAHVTDLPRAGQCGRTTGAACGRTLRQLELARSKFGGSDRSLLGVGRVRIVLTPSVGKRLSGRLYSG